MTENRILATINESPRMRRRFHNLEKEKRRTLLYELNGHLDERTFNKALRRIKRIAKNQAN